MSDPSHVCWVSNSGDDLKYSDIRQTANSCRLCGLCVKVLEAFANGCFPVLFRGARDKAQRAEILKRLEFTPQWEHYRMHGANFMIFFKGTYLKLVISRESDEGSTFAVEGVSFPSLRRPRFSDRHYPHRSLERAGAWLRKCLDQHNCGKSDFYPKRLLDLREDPIRLFETNKIKQFKDPYVCLSHRWGSPKHQRLTSTVGNIHNHMKGIAWDEIPKTFQDAIMVCRRMSVSYLWIDTVCILQGYSGMSAKDAATTEADFAAQNSAMARIYQNSQFTICASMSTSMDSGIFSARKNCRRIKTTGDDGTEAILRVTVVHSHNTPPSDLETRGWTYQEYLLPPRILEFGPFDISWRCQEERLCECADIGLESNWGWREEMSKQTRPPRNVKGEAEQWWVRTVQHYTARSLTNYQDKLPALSGLAQIYHGVTGDDYLAGLWKASLPHSLCWYHCSGKDIGGTAAIGIGRRPQAYRAPSWSWASIDALDIAQCRTWWPGTIDDGISLILYEDYERFDLRELCTIYEVDVQPKTGDSFGEVAPGGFLQLGVTLISAKIDTKIDTNAPRRGHFWYMDNFRDDAAWALNHVDKDDTNVVFCLPDCGMEDDGLEHGDQVYCAPLLERLCGWDSEIGCLVLKRLRCQAYRRVGFCILLKKNPNPSYSQTRYHWGLEVPEHASWAQWSLDTETRIKIV